MFILYKYIVCITICDNLSMCNRYEVNFQKGLSCGGAYLKLLSDEADSDLVSIKIPSV